MDIPKTIITKSTEETKKFGANLAKIGDKRILCLYGDLGSGKTTFTQGFAQGLGITKRLLSPTFIIVRRYTLGATKFFYHIDLYRMKNMSDINELGLSEIFNDPGNIVVIEWAERLEALTPENRLDVHFSVQKDERHTITLT